MILTLQRRALPGRAQHSDPFMRGNGIDTATLGAAQHGTAQRSFYAGRQTRHSRATPCPARRG